MRNKESYLSNVCFDDFVVLLEYICVNQLVLLGGLEVHAVVVAETLLQAFKVFIEKYVLKHSDSVIKVIIFLILSWRPLKEWLKLPSLANMNSSSSSMSSPIDMKGHPRI